MCCRSGLILDHPRLSPISFRILLWIRDRSPSSRDRLGWLIQARPVVDPRSPLGPLSAVDPEWTGVRPPIRNGVDPGPVRGRSAVGGRHVIDAIRARLWINPDRTEIDPDRSSVERGSAADRRSTTGRYTIDPVSIRPDRPLANPCAIPCRIGSIPCRSQVDCRLGVEPGSIRGRSLLNTGSIPIDPVSIPCRNTSIPCRSLIDHRLAVDPGRTPDRSRWTPRYRPDSIPSRPNRAQRRPAASRRWLPKQPGCWSHALLPCRTRAMHNISQDSNMLLMIMLKHGSLLDVCPRHTMPTYLLIASIAI